MMWNVYKLSNVKFLWVVKSCMSFCLNTNKKLGENTRKLKAVKELKNKLPHIEGCKDIYSYFIGIANHKNLSILASHISIRAFSYTQSLKSIYFHMLDWINLKLNYNWVYNLFLLEEITLYHLKYAYFYTLSTKLFFCFTLPCELYDFFTLPFRGLPDSCPIEYSSNVLPRVKFLFRWIVLGSLEMTKHKNCVVQMVKWNKKKIIDKM